MAFRKRPKSLYHYCPMETFLAIINNRSFRLGDIRMSNDTWEIDWGFTNVTTSAAVISDIGSHHKDSLADMHAPFHEPGKENEGTYVTWDGTPESSPHCLACFAENPVLLEEAAQYENADLVYGGPIRPQARTDE